MSSSTNDSSSLFRMKESFEIILDCDCGLGYPHRKLRCDFQSLAKVRLDMFKNISLSYGQCLGPETSQHDSGKEIYQSLLPINILDISPDKMEHSNR